MTCTQSSLAAAKDELEMSCDDKGAMEQSFSVRAVGKTGVPQQESPKLNLGPVGNGKTTSGRPVLRQPA